MAPIATFVICKTDTSIDTQQNAPDLKIKLMRSYHPLEGKTLKDDFTLPEALDITGTVQS